MNCREFVDFISRYVDGEMPPVERAVFCEHLAQCANCRDYLVSCEKTLALGLSVCCDDEDLPDKIPDDVVKAVLEARKSQ